MLKTSVLILVLNATLISTASAGFMNRCKGTQTTKLTSCASAHCPVRNCAQWLGDWYFNAPDASGASKWVQCSGKDTIGFCKK